MLLYSCLNNCYSFRARERAPTAPTSQPPAATTPDRGRPKPPEPKRSQASAPPDMEVDMAPPSSPPQQPQKQGTGKALFRLQTNRARVWLCPLPPPACLPN